MTEKFDKLLENFQFALNIIFCMQTGNVSCISQLDRDNTDIKHNLLFCWKTTFKFSIALL